MKYPCLVAGIMLVISAAGCCTSGPRLIQQEQKYWCWAASGQMIMSYHDHDVSQSRQAHDSPKNLVNGQKKHDCLGSPKDCNWTGYPQFDIYPYDSNSKFSVTTRQKGDIPDFKDLKSILCKDGCRKNPIAFQADYHMMVALEAQTTVTGEQQVYVFDPGPWPDGASAGFIKYWEYKGLDEALHVEFYNIRPPE